MYIDLIIRIKNAQAAGKASIKVPYSKMDKEIVDVLLKHNYIAAAEKKGRGVKKFFEIALKGENPTNVITGVNVISKPSRRFYVGYRDLWPVKNSFGIGVLSTPGGVMTGQEARRKKLGGEYLFEIW